MHNIQLPFYNPLNSFHTMKELVAKISELCAAFEKEAKLNVENCNKAAGTRARKASLELEKLMKQYRKDSIEASK